MKKSKKKFNRLGLLGLLGLMVFIWPVTGQWPFIMTIGYFTFFKYLWTIPDELFMENVRTSASGGFFLTQIMMAVTIVSWAVFSVTLNWIKAFHILYWGMLISIFAGFMFFSFRLAHLDNKEKKDIKNFS